MTARDQVERIRWDLKNPSPLLLFREEGGLRMEGCRNTRETIQNNQDQRKKKTKGGQK